MSEGELKIDDYQLINCIATGNYSQVWEASLGGSSEHVALKVLLPDSLKDRDQVAVLKHEGRVAKAMEHPQFLRFHKAVFNRKNGYLVMEYFNAPNAKTLLLNDPLAIQVRFRKLVESLCLALGYMHDKGWLHRDLKPDNILFNRASELKLIDFSLATRWSKGLGKVFSGGKAKTIQGTRTYIAPETLLKKPATPQTDMYSLGITLFELLTGQPPFKGTSPRDLLKRHLEEKPPMVSAYNKNVTPELDRFVLRLLAKKPADRHKTMTEVHTEFRSLKMFKEEPQDLADRQVAERKKKEMDALASLDKRLDSRADAKRTELGTHPPAQPKKKVPKPQAEPKPVAAAQAPQQPMAPPPGYWPAPQGMPPGGWPYPFPPPPPGQAPPPGYPPQFAPGYPPQYAPAAGPQQPPPGAMPAPPPDTVPAHVPLRQPPPPGGRAPQNGPAPQGEQPPKRAPQPVPPPAKDKPDDDLPFMDELPEVI